MVIPAGLSLHPNTSRSAVRHEYAQLLPDREVSRLKKRREQKMLKTSILCMSLIAISCHFAHAQDIAGIEDCTKTTGLDKRTSCLQSNVNFLQRLVTKNALEAGQKLNAAASEIMSLKNAVTTLQTAIQEIKAAQKPANEKKTDRLP
jgi:hypothetical protein